MTRIDRAQVTALTRKTRDVVEVWRRERREALARQLAANAEIKQHWLASNPIEVSQQQRGYHAHTKRQDEEEISIARQASLHR
jgi:hypothetical protein